MYAIRTRFIPDTITEHFEQRPWPAAREDASTPRAPIKAVDIAARGQKQVAVILLSYSPSIRSFE
jgi:hypothetical protein